MSFSLIPKYSLPCLTAIKPEFLSGIGVKLLMMDLDNTIAPYGTDSPSGEILRWSDAMKNHGIKLFIVSNNRRRERVEAFSRALGTGFINRAGKPSPKGVISAMIKAGFSARDCALAGDQIFTDALAANLAGIASIVVPPVSYRNPAFALRYALESPFRALCKNKIGGVCLEQH